MKTYTATAIVVIDKGESVSLIKRITKTFPHWDSLRQVADWAKESAKDGELRKVIMRGIENG